MDDLWNRFIQDLVERVTGPMKFRLLMQPLMAALFAIRSGVADAKAGNPPYLLTLFQDQAQRRALLREAWVSVGKIFVIALLLDAIYQLIVERFVYPLETITVAFLLAIVPYVLLRGVVTRVVRRTK